MRLKVPPIKVINSYRGRFAMLIGAVVVVLVLIVFLAGSSPSPIPKAISSAVAFKVYYPDSSQLPGGYTLNTSSIELIKPGVVIYDIGIPRQKQNVVISEEVKPDAATISRFLSDYIPLHTSFNTPLGGASVGAYSSGGTLRSVISLPITNGPWVIATAPSNINYSQFERIVESLIKN